MDLLRETAVVNDRFIITNLLTAENRHEQLSGIFSGLDSPQKYISSRYFYDEYGSLLFEKITETPEYYQTRTEKSILRSIAPLIAGYRDHIDIVEPGSGDCSKISILLDAIPEGRLNLVRYVPVDVCIPAIVKSAEYLTSAYPGLSVHGIAADFMKHLTEIPGKSNTLICFFGSTIGNLDRQQSVHFLKEVELFMKQGDRFLLGLDMVKDTRIIEAAYRDKQGITALFNKNILKVINDTAGTSFDTREFEHMAFYNKSEERIEMHLLASKDMVVESEYFPHPILIRKSETIHTENSHKYTPEDISYFGEVTGLSIENVYTDDKKWFSVVSFRKD